MTHTNSRRDIAERVGLGVCGATLVLWSAVANWIDSTFYTVHDEAVKAVEYGAGIALIIAWVMAIWATSREPEPHWWGCFFKAVGIPGSIVAAGRAFQVFG